MLKDDTFVALRAALQAELNAAPDAEALLARTEQELERWPEPTEGTPAMAETVLMVLREVVAAERARRRPPS